MSALPDRVAILIITVDGIVADSRIIGPNWSQQDIIDDLVEYSKTLGHIYQQAELVDESPDTYQLDFTTKDRLSATALAAVFTATRH